MKTKEQTVQILPEEAETPLQTREKSSDCINGSSEPMQEQAEKTTPTPPEKEREESDVKNKLQSVVDDIKQQKVARLYHSLLGEAAELKKENDGFSLETELDSDVFCRLVASGLSLRQAFRACHVDEILEKALDDCRKQCVKEFTREVHRRARENGITASATRASSAVDYLSPSGIEEILRRVENGAKISF